MMGFTIIYKYEGMSLTELSEVLEDFEMKLKQKTTSLECVELKIIHAKEGES